MAWDGKGVVVGLLLGVILTLAILVLVGSVGNVAVYTLSSDGTGPAQINFTGVLKGDYVIDGGVVVEKADLRLIALPYLASTNVQTVCLAGGGVWHEDKDFVGCVGVGTVDCNTGVVISARTQCIGANAEWVCDGNNLYCKY